MGEKKQADSAEVKGMEEETRERREDSTEARALILQLLKPDYFPAFLQCGGSVRCPSPEKHLLAKTSPSLVSVTHNDPLTSSVQIILSG